MIDQASVIREDVDRENCVPVKLADGQNWLLPKPWIVIHPVFRDGKAVESVKYLSYGPELDGLIRMISEAESPTDQVLATMSLGAFLLLRNYDLTNEQLESLFRYRAGDPDSEEMTRTIIETATGTGGKKAGAGG